MTTNHPISFIAAPASASQLAGEIADDCFDRCTSCDQALTFDSDPTSEPCWFCGTLETPEVMV